MKVSEVMSERPFTVTRDMPLRLVATRMLEYGISGMPVVEDGRVVGVVSETDILFKERTLPERATLREWLAHYPEDPPRAKVEARTAGEAMTAPAVTIAPGRTVADAAALMLDLQIDRLPVVSGGFLVGLVSRSDIIRAFANEPDDPRPVGRSPGAGRARTRVISHH